MPVDAPVIAGLAQELRYLLPLKIERISQPYPDEFLLACFGSGVSSKILVSLHPQYGRIVLFQGERDEPLSPSAFCMSLRKHFSGGKLVEISAVPFERICKLTFEVYDHYLGLNKKDLRLELTGKSSNLVIVNGEGIIIDAWRKLDSPQTAGRELKPGVKYEFPGVGGRWKPVTLSWEQFSDLISGIPPDIPLEKFLLKHWYGLSELAVREIAEAAGVYSNTLCGGIPAARLRNVYDQFTVWAETVSSERFEPWCLYGPDGKAASCSAFPIRHPPDGYTARKIDSLNRAVSGIMESNLESHRFDTLKDNLLHQVKKRLDKAQTKLAKQNAEAEVAGRGDFYRISGELLTTYCNQIKKGTAEAKLINHYDPRNAEILIPLDPALTPLENARNYFKKYQKAKKGRQAIAVQLNKTRETIDYLESVATLIENARSLSDLKLVQTELEDGDRVVVAGNHPGKPKKEPPAEPRRFVTPDGDIILVGRNNLQNDRLTFKIAGPGDLWFHTQKIPGSHVILKLKPGNSATDQALNYACQLAAYFSKARQSTKIPVDYTQRKNVDKPPGSRPGFVVYNLFKTVIITPDPELLHKIGLKEN